jgi:hypothetical protein
METLMTLYSFIGGKDRKKKERFDFILEPLQAMTQLALLAYCPIGAKLSIANNILYIQMPTWSQGLTRNYNKDSREDVFFLFNAISRFSKFYNTDNTHTDDLDLDHLHNTKQLLYELLVKMSQAGIDKMIQTYANVEQPSLLHTLQMYRTMLDKHMQLAAHQDMTTAKDDIENVFLQITKIYSDEEYNILYSTFKLLAKNPTDYLTYIDTINATMSPRYLEIKKWINENIVY